jgi:hypothetical protein
VSRLARAVLAVVVLAHLLVARFGVGPATPPAPSEVTPEHLVEAAARIPATATVLLLNDGDQWEAFQASHVLYPRKVVWGLPAPRVSSLDWHVPISLEAAAFRDLLARERIGYVLVVGVDPARIPPVPGSRIVRLGGGQVLIEPGP